MTEHPQTYEPTPEERAARAKRNWAIMGAILAFVVLVFAFSLIRMKMHWSDRMVAERAAAQEAAEAADKTADDAAQAAPPAPEERP